MRSAAAFPRTNEQDILDSFPVGKRSFESASSIQRLPVSRTSARYSALDFPIPSTVCNSSTEAEKTPERDPNFEISLCAAGFVSRLGIA